MSIHKEFRSESVLLITGRSREIISFLFSSLALELKVAPIRLRASRMRLEITISE